jgi:hypothetical protein
MKRRPWRDFRLARGKPFEYLFGGSHVTWPLHCVESIAQLHENQGCLAFPRQRNRLQRPVASNLFAYPTASQLPRQANKWIAFCRERSGQFEVDSSWTSQRTDFDVLSLLTFIGGVRHIRVGATKAQDSCHLARLEPAQSFEGEIATSWTCLTSLCCQAD